jgi:hypothetical protein
MDEIICVVIGRFGMAFSTQYNCGRNFRCKCTFKSSELMIPRARVVAYYIKDSGAAIYGITELSFDEFGENFVSKKIKFVK